MTTTVDEVIARLPRGPGNPLPAPAYTGTAGKGVGLAVESMRRHVSSEGFDVFAGLQMAGYVLHGHDIGPSLTDVPEILRRENPAIVVVQDRREYMGLTADRSRDHRMQFRNVEALRERPDIFRLTIVKDAHSDPAYLRATAEAIQAHAVITYYHPRIVCHLAPHIRPDHLLRTYHTIDPALVLPYSPDGRAGCLLSGAVSGAYPLRQRLLASLDRLPGVEVLPHPGYKADYCRTPEFLRTLSRFKVAICTASRFGYLLKKLIEASAAGCRVVTDLPSDERLPFLDGNLVRVHPDDSARHVGHVVEREIRNYDADRQRHYAEAALAAYDNRDVCLRLAEDIERLRGGYNAAGRAD